MFTFTATYRERHRTALTGIIAILLPILIPFFILLTPEVTNAAWLCPPGLTVVRSANYPETDASFAYQCQDSQGVLRGYAVNTDRATCPNGQTVQVVQHPSGFANSYNCVNSSGQVTGSADRKISTDCTASMTNWAPLFSPVCWGRTLSVIIGAFLISATAWLLSVAGLTFNWLVDHTVVQFGLLYDKIKPAVEIVWTVFRDVANILIVGLFVFIAISLIVGIKEYGQRRMIARVLIVAVLINFSLLFTKIIIDASNFVALQFYNAASLPEGGNSGITFTDYSQSGISGRFIELMGVTTLSDTVKALENNAFGSQGQDYTDANGARAFILGLFGATLLLAAAGVLLYGVYLLMVRAILIIFLMITSALAFASYLIPKYSTEGVGEQYGWKAWWGALLRAAAFGPLLMMFLWATLFIGTQVKSSQGTLGDLLTNTTNAANLQALFSYLLVLGLLFASIKLASSFSSTVGGFNIAAAFARAPFTYGVGGLGGLLGRMTLGKMAYHRASGLEKESKEAGTLASRADFGARAALRVGNVALAKQATEEAERQREIARKKQEAAGKMNKLADSSFNIMQSRLAKALGAKADDKQKGYASQIKEAAKEVAKEASKVEPSSEVFKEMRQATERSVREQREISQQQLDEQRRANEEAARTAESTRQSIETSKAAAEETANRTADALKNAVTEAARNASIGGNPQYVAAMEKASKLKEEHDRARAAYEASAGSDERRRSELRHEAERIRAAQRLALEQGAEIAARIDSNIAAPLQDFKAAHTAVEELSGKLDAAKGDAQAAQQAAKVAATAVEAHRAETPKIIKEALEKEAKGQSDSLAAYAKLIANHQAGLGEKLFGATDDIAAAARKSVDGDKKNKRLKDLADQISKATKEAK